jgi:hypothetical protein
MSLFEFVTVMISMILALSLGQMLRSASYIAKTEREVARSRAYTIWFVVIVLAVINHWWSLWDLQSIDWNYASFLYVIIAPVLITFASGLLTPSRSGSGPIDLPGQFARVRRLFSIVMVSYAIAMWFDGPLLAGQPVFGFVGVLHIPIITASLVPWVSGGERANILAGATMIATLLVVMVVRFATM